MREPMAAQCAAALAGEAELLISAATLAEALILAGRRGLAEEMSRLVESIGLQVIDVTRLSAIRAADAYRKWGRGQHPAGLSYGDCFAYELAASQGCPLLYVGNDFAKTDLASAL